MIVTFDVEATPHWADFAMFFLASQFEIKVSLQFHWVLKIIDSLESLQSNEVNRILFLT